MRLVKIADVSELTGVPGTQTVSALSAELFALHAPESHWLLLDGKNRLAARCSLWVESVHHPMSRRTGVVGHFAAADSECGAEILRAACAELHARGCDLAIGPMDGNTWRSYRLVSQRGVEPPFFLEPDNPDHYVTAFEHAGFSPLAQYYSSLVPDLATVDGRLGAVAQRLAALGVTIRPLDMAAFERDARGAWQVSLQSFREAFLYTPLDEKEFMASYQKLKAYLRPEFCFLAEYRSAVVGFVLSVPDMLQARRGEATDTLVVKSLAVLPKRQYAGLGALLIERAQHAAKAAGFRRGIHALMHESNRSRNINGRGTEIRRYTLFSRPV